MSFVLIKNSANTITTMTNIPFGSISKSHRTKKRRIKNAKLITYYQWKSKAFKTMLFVCNVILLALVICFSESETLIQTQDQRWHVSDSMLVTAVCSAIFYGFSVWNQFQVKRQSLQEYETFQITFGEYFRSIVLAIILLIHPSCYAEGIYLKNGDTIITKVNILLTVGSYLRVFFICKFLTTVSKYYGTRVSRLLQVYGHRNQIPNIMYAIKCMFRQQSGVTNMTLFVIATVFFALIGIQVSDQTDIRTYMYFCLETLATIGYGEIKTQYFFQRMVLIFVIVFGSFAGSAFTIYLLESLELEDKQAKAYRLIKRLECQRTIKNQKLSLVKTFLNKKNYEGHSKIWKTHQKQLQIDKSPIIQFLTTKHAYFCNSLKTLLESQLLSSNLLTFYFARRQNQQLIAQKSPIISRRLNVSNTPGQKRKPNTRRTEDSKKLFELKQKIIGRQ